VAAIDLAIHRVSYASADVFHQAVKQMYNWNDIAERTEKVYYHMKEMPDYPLIERLRRYYGCGTWAGKIFCFIVALDFLFHLFLKLILPEEEIDIAPDLRLLHTDSFNDPFLKQHIRTTSSIV
jgi:phosphatidylinositol glycan class A protein